MAFKLNRKRNDIEITADILKVAREGAKKSHIVYKTNLNFKIAKKYLNYLKKAGLIVGPLGNKRLFKTTEKGINYLKYFHGFKNYVSPGYMS